MKIGVALDDSEITDRRELFRKNIAIRKWYACVASADLRYFIPILKSKDGRFSHSLPIAFRNLGMKSLMKKNYADARRAAEERIREAAAVSSDGPPLITFFNPIEKKRTAWKRTRNVFNCQQQPGASIEVRRFRPQEIGWRHCIRRVISLDLSPAAKILLLYAYDRGFQSGEFYASSKTASEETGIHEVHVKRLLPHLAKLKHLERVKRDPPKGVWRYALLAPVHELPRSNLKLPDEGTESDAGNLKLPTAVTLGANSGNLSLPKADKGNKTDSSRITRDRDGEPDQNTPSPEIDKATRSYCEKELLAHLAGIMGPSEMLKNAAMWRLRIRSSHLAITGAIKEYYGVSPNEREKIKNRAAWITDRYSSYGGKSVEKGEIVELPWPD